MIDGVIRCSKCLRSVQLTNQRKGTDKINNAEVKAGVYVYYLEVKVGDEVIQKLGDITVLR